MKSIYEQARKFKDKYFLTIAWRLKKHSNIVEKYINPDEQPLYTFIGQKNDNIFDFFDTTVITLTTKRLLVGRKRVVFGHLVDSITPEMYNDLNLYSGLIWGKITIDTLKEEIVLTKIDKSALDEIETQITSFMMNAKNNKNKNQ